MYIYSNENNPSPKLSLGIIYYIIYLYKVIVWIVIILWVLINGQMLCLIDVLRVHATRWKWNEILIVFVYCQCMQQHSSTDLTGGTSSHVFNFLFKKKYFKNTPQDTFSSLLFNLIERKRLVFLSLALGPIWWGSQGKSSLQVFDRWDEQVMPAGDGVCTWLPMPSQHHNFFFWHSPDAPAWKSTAWSCHARHGIAVPKAPTRVGVGPGTAR